MSLALLIASLVATALQTIPGIPSAVATGINSLSAVLGVILKNGVPTSLNAAAILTTLSAAIVALKSQPGLSQAILSDIQVLEDAVQAAFAADAHASQQVDATTLHQEASIA